MIVLVVLADPSTLHRSSLHVGADDGGSLDCNSRTRVVIAWLKHERIFSFVHRCDTRKVSMRVASEPSFEDRLMMLADEGGWVVTHSQRSIGGDGVMQADVGLDVWLGSSKISDSLHGQRHLNPESCLVVGSTSIERSFLSGDQ